MSGGENPPWIENRSSTDGAPVTEHRMSKIFFLNSQAPDVPELTHQGIFQRSRLSVNCYDKTMKKYPRHLNLKDFMNILSVPQDHCDNNLMNFFSKNNSYFKFFSELKTALEVNRYLFGISSTFENVRDILKRSDNGLTVFVRSGISGAWGPCFFGRLRIKSQKFNEIKLYQFKYFYPVIWQSSEQWKATN